MFKISEFSQLSQVSVKTLRYYDQLGLLKPAHADPLTGYRYYTAEQLLLLNRILAFKELGFTLEQITRLLDEQVPPEQIRGMFRLKQAQIQELIEGEQTRLARIEGRLRQIEREGTLASQQEVVLKMVEPQLIASIRERTSPTSIPLLFSCLSQRPGAGKPTRAEGGSGCGDPLYRYEPWSDVMGCSLSTRSNMTTV